MKKIIIVIGLVMILAACTATTEKGKATLNRDVNCATAEEDIRTLEAEKKSAGQRTAAGVSAIIPIGLVVHTVKGEEGETLEVASGEYNEMIDKKIALIKSECGIE